MTDLVDFLRARLADREAKARKLVGDLPGRWIVGVDEHHEYVEVIGALREDAQPGDGYWYAVCSWDIAAIAADTGTDDFDDIELDCVAQAEHMAANDPATVLREVAAKRRIIDEHEVTDQGCETCGNSDPTGLHEQRTDGPCATLRLLALPHADHEEFEDGWRV